ncbi:rhamnosyltransferase WsaF family glycosyltransferase [Allocoleopsis franciscana]|uniref:Glycosyltransferase n=1 Tax=Allocoleopsis franciscana PCC 7113 TaxID=1173027 RepID=K9WMY5_9CYAN|nr:glycosyltransferase [Allocoleopsis franciscana]AFZ20917.1 glycosyltransferase [Allocoleopsis franciscana PCC 7113]
MYQDSQTNNKPVQLHVMHSWGGGIERWVRDYSHTDILRTNLVLKSSGVPGIPGQRLELYQSIDIDIPTRVWELTLPIHATSVTNLDYRYALDEIINHFNVSAILISSFIGHSLDILNTNLETTVICHDYYPFCPAINIYFGKVCKECNFSHLQHCFKENPYNNLFPQASASEWMPIRKSFLKLIQHHKVTLVAPSDSVKRNLIKLEPALANVQFKIIPHGAELPIHSDIELDDLHQENRKLKILILGRLVFHKGLELLKEIYQEILDVADIFLLGCGATGQNFQEMPGIHIVAEQYSLDDLPKLVGQISPDLGLLLSIVPETFSYTLSELSLLEIPVLATNLGSFQDRIKEGVNGFLVTPEKNALIDKIRELSEQRHLLAKVSTYLKGISHRTLQEMVENYYEVVTLTHPPQSKASRELNALNLEPSELERSHSQIVNTQIKLEQTQTQLQQTQAELNKALFQMQETKFGLERSQSQLERSQSQLERSHSQLQHTQAELGKSQSQLLQAKALISGMESSKFWRLRLAWFKVKDILNLVSDSEIYRPNALASLSDNSRFNNNPGFSKNISKMFAFISGCPGDAYRYRCHHQAEILRYVGYAVDVYEPNLFLYEELLKNYRIIVAHRVPYTYEFEQFVAKANNLGLKVIFETDDLVFDTSLLHQIDAYMKMDLKDKQLYEDGVRRYRKALSLCEAVVVSTEKLKQKIEKSFPEKAVVISRNRISSDMEQEAIKARDIYIPDDQLIRIAYFSGTRTHAKDFAECVYALSSILKEFPDVRLMVVGHLDIPEELQPFSSQIEKFPFLPWQDLPGLYRKVTINLAPLEKNNDFTESKSELKYFEAGLVSVPTVASNWGAFRVGITDGVNGRLCSNPQEWENALRELITNPKLRQEMGQKAFDDVNARYLTRTAATLTGKAWQTLVGGKILPDKPLSIAFVLRAPIAQTGGGYKHIFYLAHYLAEQGHNVNIYVEPMAHLTGFTPEQVQKFCEENFGKSKAIIHCGHADIVESDVAIATNWPTAYVVDKLVNTRFKAYYVQDYEPYFYEPDDPCFLQAEATYDLPLGIICLDKYLSQVLSKRNRIQYPYINFPLNEAFLAKAPVLTRHCNPDRSCSILFFARPNIPRRNFAVGVEALDKLHQQNPDVQIKLYGMEEAIELPFPYQNLGVLTQSEAAEAMRSSDIHLSFSLTNISTVVFEAMACGCATVEADVPPVRGMVEDGKTCILAEPNSQAVSEALMELVNNPVLRREIASAGYESAKTLTVARMCSKFEQLLNQYTFRTA